MTAAVLSIGEVAARSGLATSAIRYYEELGLVQPVARQSGRRLFAESAANRMRAVTAAREAGFSLDEIRRLLNSQVEGTEVWRDLVEEKITQLSTRIERLRAVETLLRDSLTCGCRAWDDCPILLGACQPAPATASGNATGQDCA